MKRSTTALARPYTSPFERTASVIFLLLQAPRTIPEMIEVLGMPTKLTNGNRNTTSWTTLGRCLKALEAEGVVEAVGSRALPLGAKGRRATIWAWAILPSRYTLSQDELE
jgi:hypothetical protein